LARPVAALFLALSLLGAPSGTGALAAQGSDPAETTSKREPPTPAEEQALLRRASSLEWQGELDAAEELLTGLLTRAPTSSGALFSLERILRSRNRVRRVLPWADRFLDAEPGASAARYMKLRVLVEIDSLEALRDEATRWFEAEPRSPDPYREVARLYARAMGPSAALEVIDRGRWALKRDGLLAVEAGDLRLSAGDIDGAVQEWAGALRESDADVAGVVRRVERLEEAASRAEPVLAALSQRSASADRRLAGVALAIRLGMEERARRAAADGLDALPSEETTSYLRDVAREADAGGMPGLSLWALTTLRQEGAGAQADLQGEARLAAAALSAGDTAAAVAAQRRLVRGLPTGSVERRRALGDLLRVESAWSGAAAGTLRTRLDALRREYPDAPELDALIAATAGGLVARGAEDEALEVLGGPVGPRSLRERAWLHFRRGEIGPGRDALDAALPGLVPSEATEVIRLLAALERVSPAGAQMLARAAALGEQEGAARARAVLDSAVAVVPVEERAPVRFQLAGWAVQAGDTSSAQRALAALVEEDPEAPEVPEAILFHARLLAAGQGGRAVARELLTQLILDRPQAAVVPEARRELARISDGGGGS
jgi:hypothetical protein